MFGFEDLLKGRSMAPLTRNMAKQAGLTVIELMAAIGIIGILVAVATPSLLSTLPGLRLNDAARQVATDLQMARMRAIAQNSSNTITFNTSTGTYTFTLGNESIDIDQLYPGITFSSVPANPVFTSRGTASTTATITLSNGNATKQVEVTSVGRVRIL
jgi:prepilin-type N-terminal cleavage/methylation domain-containing protein